MNEQPSETQQNLQAELSKLQQQVAQSQQNALAAIGLASMAFTLSILQYLDLL